MQGTPKHDGFDTSAELPTGLHRLFSKAPGIVKIWDKVATRLCKTAGTFCTSAKASRHWHGVKLQNIVVEQLSYCLSVMRVMKPGAKAGMSPQL